MAEKGTDNLVVRIAQHETDLKEWLNNQSNKSHSIKKLIRDCIRVHGMQDLDDLPVIADYLRGDLQQPKRRPGRPRKSETLQQNVPEQQVQYIPKETSDSLAPQPVVQNYQPVMQQSQSEPIQKPIVEQSISNQASNEINDIKTKLGIDLNQISSSVFDNTSENQSIVTNTVEQPVVNTNVTKSEENKPNTVPNSIEDVDADLLNHFN